LTSQLTSQRVLLLLLALLGFSQIGYWAVVAEGIEKPLDAVCASWDGEASVGVALLVPSTTALDESRLDDALFRLRRARKNCRAGWLDVARQDYGSLRDEFPFPGRPLAEANGQKARPQRP
jgi:hypothetical protein